MVWDENSFVSFLPPDEDAGAFLETLLEQYRIAFTEGGIISSLVSAFAICFKNDREIPDWLGYAILEVLDREVKNSAVNDRGRNTKWVTQRRQDIIDAERAGAVEICRHLGVPPIDSFDIASQLLEGSFAEAKEDAVKKSTEKFARRYANNPARYMPLLGLPPIIENEKSRGFRYFVTIPHASFTLSHELCEMIRPYAVGCPSKRLNTLPRHYSANEEELESFAEEDPIIPIG